MKSPRGFGKNYFSFSAMLTYTVQNSLDAKVSSIYSLLSNRLLKQSEELDEDDPPLEVLETTCSATDRPCHCNCFYGLKTKLATLLYHFIPRYPYYNEKLNPLNNYHIQRGLLKGKFFA